MLSCCQNLLLFCSNTGTFQFLYGYCCICVVHQKSSEVIPLRPDTRSTLCLKPLDQYAQTFERLCLAIFPLKLSALVVFFPQFFSFFRQSDISLYVITALSFPLKLSFTTTKMPTIHLEKRELLNQNWLKHLGIKIESFGLWIIILCRYKDVLKNDNTKDRVIIVSVWIVAPHCDWLRGRAMRGFIFRIRKLNYERKWPNKKGCSDSMELPGLSRFEALHLKVS